MNYSISHLSLFLGIFVILSSQTLSNDASEAVAPSSDIRSKICSAELTCRKVFGGVAGVEAANDFILSDVDLDSLTEDSMDDGTNFEPPRRRRRNRRHRRQASAGSGCSAQLTCGGQIGFANNIIFPASESEKETFNGNTFMKNDDTQNIPGNRRLLSDIGAEIEFP